MTDTGEPAVLVVGRNSYIGGYLCDYAKRRGWEVRGVGSADCDFRRPAEVREFFSALPRRPHAVVFLSVVNKSVENSYRSYTENVSMVRNLIDGCRYAEIRSTIYFSSVDVYGRRPALPVTEASPVAPDTWYGLAKYSCEWMLRFSGEVSSPVAVLRLPGVYGRWANDRSVVGRMVASVRSQGQVVIRGTGERLRDFVYLEDVARVVEGLLPIRYDGVLNVATGVSRPIREIADVVGRVLGLRFGLVHESPEPARDFDLCFDTRAVGSVLPGFRFTELEAGVRTYA